MLVLALAVAALTVAILAAYVAVAEYTIRELKETLRVQAATERRLTNNVRTLQAELVHHAAVSQVVVLWRNRNLSTEREGNRQ